MNRLADNLGSPDFWFRLLYTLVFAVAWQVSELLIVLVAVLQLGYRLFTGAPETRLSEFGGSLSTYAGQIGRYVTQASEQKPWPFIEWPAERTATARTDTAAAANSAASEAPGQP